MTFEREYDFACKPAPRPRIVRGKASRDHEYQGWKQRVAMDWRMEHGERCLGFETYEVRIIICGPMRGDLDNYAKSVLDALVGVALPSDAVKYLRRLEVEYNGKQSTFFRVEITGR